VGRDHLGPEGAWKKKGKGNAILHESGSSATRRKEKERKKKVGKNCNYLQNRFDGKSRGGSP